jgi:hypothetical protein
MESPNAAGANAASNAAATAHVKMALEVVGKEAGSGRIEADGCDGNE